MTQIIISSYRQERPEAQYQLFILPHSGGSMTYFLPWQKIMPASIELNFVQLPGRGTTFKHPPVTDWPEVIEAVSESIEKLNDGRPFALFGHSLGALIAFEVAHKLQHKNLVHLFASGMRSPIHYQVPRRRYTMTDTELINYVANTDVANTKKDENYFQYLKFLLPTIRADFQLVDTYEYHHQNLVMCPISVMFGEEDTLHTREEFLDWKAVAGKDFDFKAFPGGHMYLGHESQQVVEYLSNSLMSSGPL